jgi:hypothetical protein
MHSRKAAYMTGRWRLSVHNTASTSDTEQYITHYTRCPTEVPAALTTLGHCVYLTEAWIVRDTR